MELWVNEPFLRVAQLGGDYMLLNGAVDPEVELLPIRDNGDPLAFGGPLFGIGALT